MTERPLFIPLKREFYEAFVSGEKGEEYRLYGKRWNEKTCRVGRAVTLSLGYGKAHRTAGTVKEFRSLPIQCLPYDARLSITSCYGPLEESRRIACIKVGWLT